MIFLIAVRKELLEQWRSYRLLVVVVVFVILGLLSPLAAKLTPEIVKLLPEGEEIAKLIPSPTVADAIVQYTRNLSQFGVILALLMTMGMVVQEKDKGTAALILAKPMSRGIFIGSKFVALGLTFTVGIAMAGIASYCYTVLLFRDPGVSGWLALNGALLLFLLVYVALTLFCSTVSKSLVAAGGLAFGAMLVLTSVGGLTKMSRYLPGRLVSWAAEVSFWVGETPWPALLASVGIIVVAFVGAWMIFERQEL